MVFKPLADRTRWEGVVACCWLAFFDLLLVVWALRRPVDWLKFLFVFMAVISLPLLAYWAYRTWAAFTLRYTVEREGLTVLWAGERRTISFGAMRQMMLAGVVETGRANPLCWPAPFLRAAHGLGVDKTTMLATAPLDECIVVEADDGAFAISPAEATPLVETMQARYAAYTPGAHVPSTATAPMWTRALGGRAGPVLILAGLLGVLVLVGVLMVNFPSLPETLALQYNSEGIPMAIRSKSALFVLPIIGFLAWFVNGVGGMLMAVRNQPTGAYLLWGGAVLVQVCSLLALISIIP